MQYRCRSLPPGSAQQKVQFVLHPGIAKAVSSELSAAATLHPQTTPQVFTPQENVKAGAGAEDSLAQAALLSRPEERAGLASRASGKALKFLRDGGPSIWAIAALSAITLALIGARSLGKAGMAVAIPASAALTWFEAVIGRIRRDI